MKLSLIFAMLCFCLISYSQDSTCILKLPYKKISFTIYRYGMDFTSKSKVKAEMIIVTNIKETTFWKRIKSLPRERWLCYLNNPKSDWVANLVLYQLYEKDAILFKKIKSREDWIGNQRERDVKYWEIFLKHH